MRRLVFVRKQRIESAGGVKKTSTFFLYLLLIFFDMATERIEHWLKSTRLSYYEIEQILTEQRYKEILLKYRKKRTHGEIIDFDKIKNAIETIAPEAVYWTNIYREGLYEQFVHDIHNWRFKISGLNVWVSHERPRNVNHTNRPWEITVYSDDPPYIYMGRTSYDDGIAFSLSKWTTESIINLLMHLSEHTNQWKEEQQLITRLIEEGALKRNSWST